VGIKVEISINNKVARFIHVAKFIPAALLIEMLNVFNTKTTSVA